MAGRLSGLEPSVRQFCREQNWTARQRWPRSAQRGGVSPMDGANNPSPLSNEPSVTRRFLRLALRAIGCADVRSSILPPQSTILSGTKLDSASALAPQRATRRGEPHGWGEQSQFSQPSGSPATFTGCNRDGGRLRHAWCKVRRVGITSGHWNINEEPSRFLGVHREASTRGRSIWLHAERVLQKSQDGPSPALATQDDGASWPSHEAKDPPIKGCTGKAFERMHCRTCGATNGNRQLAHGA